MTDKKRWDFINKASKEVEEWEDWKKAEIYPNKIPIKRGCTNPSCFCTGKCEEIVDYKEDDMKSIWDVFRKEPKEYPDKHPKDIKNPFDNICKHPGHQPPNMLYIPPGKVHIHRCPGCGKETTMIGNRVTFYK